MKKEVLRVLFVVALGGYAGYCALSQYEFSQGQAAFETKNWLTAWEHFERVGGFYKFALPSRTSEALILRDQSGLLLLGKNMHDKGDYGSALDAYTSFIVLYPETEAASSVKELLPAIYMDWGVSLRGKSDFAGAVEKFEVVMVKYAQTSLSDPAKKADAEAYRAWGDVLAKTEDYAAAVEKYQILLTEFPTQPGTQGVKDVLGETYLKWADQLRNNKQQELALEKYNFIIANLRDTPATTKASAALAPTMLEWTQVLRQDKQFAKEVEILRKLMEGYKDTPEAQQASQKVIAAYDSLGRQLMDDKSFILSIQTYNDAGEFALDKDAKSLVDAGYKDAVQGLATDTGTDGARVISEALETACALQPAVSPAVGILKDIPDKAMVCGGSLSMPTELMPSMPGEFKYVVSINADTIQYSTCPYSGGHTLVLQINVATVTVYSTVTGRGTNSHTFRGSAPSCPYVHTFFSQTDYWAGPNVENDEIVSWLKAIFKK